ncbi:MAG TPA: M28 family peptidase [Gemmatimonadales bacterium]|nr:M28 family peptidase [Gemmatimonadales bacterium]
MSGYRALLDALARPRFVGTPQHAAVRDTLKRELQARGYVVMDHRFAAAPRFPLRGRAAAEGINLIAVRPRVRVTAWLTAHYDSKGQPLSMAGRLQLVVLALAIVPVVLLATLDGASPWWWLATLVLPLTFLALNVATDGSPGAVDNASGVLAVLAVLDLLPADAPVGAILLDAEELGLVGARALVRERANLLHDTSLINFDGIDDRGGVVAFAHRPGALTRAVADALGVRPRRRLPVVVDGLALAPAVRECLTIMKGDWGTMRVVHTPRDTADRLTLSGVAEVARAVATALTPHS